MFLHLESPHAVNLLKFFFLLIYTATFGWSIRLGLFTVGGTVTSNGRLPLYIKYIIRLACLNFRRAVAPNGLGYFYFLKCTH